MTTPSLAHTLTMHHGALHQPLTLNVQAEPASKMGACMARLKKMDSLAVRIAVPPLAIWGIMYSLVEYLA